LPTFEESGTVKSRNQAKSGQVENTMKSPKRPEIRKGEKLPTFKKPPEGDRGRERQRGLEGQNPPFKPARGRNTMKTGGPGGPKKAENQPDFKEI
jgi:hypothetical protein